MWVEILVAVAAASLGGNQPSPSDEPACPSPAVVEAQLAHLGVPPTSRPEITIAGAHMRVVLRGPAGQPPLGSREVMAPTSCQERANVAAVLVAAWMGVWPAASPPEAPAAPPRPVEEAPPLPEVRPEQGPSRLELAVALHGAHDGVAFAPGASFESRWRISSSWRVQIGLNGTWERDRSLADGRAAYARPALEAGTTLGLGGGRLRTELGLAGRLGLLLLRGKDFADNHFKTRLVPGVAGRLRLVLHGHTYSPFTTLDGVYWLGRERASLDDHQATADLPEWDLSLGVGVLWSRGP